MERKRNIIKLIVLLLIVGTVLYLSVKLRDDERDRIIKNGIVVVGTVSNVGMKTIDVSYNIEGKVFTYTENIPFKSVLQGEQFYTIVDKGDYNRALVYDNKPIFDTINFKFALVKPKSVSSPLLDNDYLDYEYAVDGKNYSRIQKFYGDVPIPKELNKLMVKYRIDRPEIGYLVKE